MSNVKKIMSRLRRDRALKRFQDILEHAYVLPFLKMIWSIDALQSGRGAQAGAHIDYPPEAETVEMSSKFFAHKWRIETIANEALLHCRRTSSIIIRRELNCRSYNAFAEVVNRLNALENAEDGLVLERGSVFNEIHKIAQQQFEWQIGFVNISSIYRYAFIFSGKEAANFFYAKYGFNLNNLSHFCFACRSALLLNPFIDAAFNFRDVGLADDVRDKIFLHLSQTLLSAKEDAFSLRSSHERTAYKPSIFRLKPLVSFSHLGRTLICAPLVDLIVLRSTSNLFYDFVTAPLRVKNEISIRFEEYAFDLIRGFLPYHGVYRSFSYEKGKRRFDFPDIFILSPIERSALIIECKANRMSFDAKFSDDPLLTCERAYKEIAKGVVQIWRSICHIRLGYITKKLPDQKYGIVLTLDSWLTMYEKKDRIFEMANELRLSN